MAFSLTGTQNPQQQNRPASPISSYFPSNAPGISYPAQQSPLEKFAASDYGKNFGAGMNMYGSAAAGQQTALQNAGSALAARIPLLGAAYNDQRNGAFGQYQNQIAGLNVDIAGNNTQQGIMRALANINSLGYQNTMGDIASQAMQQRRAATHDAVARGAYGGVGTGQDFTDINANQQYKLGGAENSYLTQQNSVMRNLGELNTQAQKYQMQPAVFENQLRQALTKLGVDQTMSVSQLMNMVSSNDFQQATLANGIIEKAMSYASANT